VALEKVRFFVIISTSSFEPGSVADLWTDEPCDGVAILPVLGMLVRSGPLVDAFEVPSCFSGLISLISGAGSGIIDSLLIFLVIYSILFLRRILARTKRLCTGVSLFRSDACCNFYGCQDFTSVLIISHELRNHLPDLQ
jgi:hypothetical protein